MKEFDICDKGIHKMNTVSSLVQVGCLRGVSQMNERRDWFRWTAAVSTMWSWTLPGGKVGRSQADAWREASCDGIRQARRLTGFKMAACVKWQNIC